MKNCLSWCLAHCRGKHQDQYQYSLLPAQQEAHGQKGAAEDESSRLQSLSEQPALVLVTGLPSSHRQIVRLTQTGLEETRASFICVTCMTGMDSHGHQGQPSQIVNQETMQPVLSLVAVSLMICVSSLEGHSCHRAAHKRIHLMCVFSSHILLRVTQLLMSGFKGNAWKRALPH